MKKSQCDRFIEIVSILNDIFKKRYIGKQTEFQLPFHSETDIKAIWRLSKSEFEDKRDLLISEILQCTLFLVSSETHSSLETFQKRLRAFEASREYPEEFRSFYMDSRFA